jgi:hypothetical protein
MDLGQYTTNHTNTHGLGLERIKQVGRVLPSKGNQATQGLLELLWLPPECKS